MKHNPHDAKRTAFSLVLASTLIMGLLLPFYVPDKRLPGPCALGVVGVPSVPISMRHLARR